jgi:ParB family transcriptional regulator, chromosome partitioning protein
MNPADECLAFGRLIEQGADVEGIARRFGLTVRFVEGRLRLSALAPAVFEALGAGEITLDVAKAYAATPDRERQTWVFEQVGRGYSGAHPDSIRRMMTQATATATDRRARFVGEEAYVAAGGRIERDLFSEDQSTRWLDVPLLERLAAEKLEALATDAAAENGLAWVRPTLDNWIGHGHLSGLHHVPVEIAPLSEEEEARIETLDAEIETLAATVDDESVTDEEREAAEAEIESRNDAIRAIVDKPPLLDQEARAVAGTFLLLGDNGQPRLHTSFYQEQAPDEHEEDEPDPGRSPAQFDGGAEGGQAAATPARPVLSQRLKEELSMQRRDILAANVAAAPDLALDLAVFLMVDPIDGYVSERSGSSLFARRPTDPVLDFRTPDAPATIALERIADGLDRTWAAHDTRAERFDAFRARCDEARAAWLAHAVARTLEVSLGGGNGGGCEFHDHLAQLLDIDVAQWWRPRASTWFDRVSKSLALEALAEIGGPAFAARYAKAKKAELSETCERIFAGEFVGEVEVKQVALSWLPAAMRFALPSVEDAPPQADDLDTPPWEEEPGEESGGSVVDERNEEAA